MSESDTAGNGTDETEQDPEYVAVGPNAWGKDRHETGALQNMTPNVPKRRLRDTDTVHVTLFRVRGFDRVDAVRGTVYADEIESREVKEVDADELRGLRSLMGEVELKAESVLVDAETVETDTDE